MSAEEWLDYLGEIALIPVIIASLTVFVLYYMFYVAKKPSIITKRDGKIWEIINDGCPILRERFWPLIWCFGSRGQTIIRSLAQSQPKMPYKREVKKMCDGGQIFLDWIQNDNNQIFPDAETRPTILLLPGITGCSAQNYMVHLVRMALEHGYRCVVFNNRGRGGADLLTPRLYCAIDTDDIGSVVKHIKAKYPQSRLLCTGVSLGGIILMHYLSEVGKDCPVEAAMAISACFDPVKNMVNIEEPINRFIYNSHLTKSLVDTIHRNLDLFAKKLTNNEMKRVLQSSTLREFDEYFTSKMNGFPSCNEYYKEAILNDKIDLIKIPLLCLNAADDPFALVSNCVYFQRWFLMMI
ncbi:protein ABHD1-like isoform X2 [Tubulanus polymorphus]|uniref:protein ABHD1-like isoform X2 n=1 Tax=Tubulanus polymorphus TaxID=672921 RepID=UPI003DA2C425